MKYRAICIALIFILAVSCFPVSARIIIQQPSQANATDYTDIDRLARVLNGIFQGDIDMYRDSTLTQEVSLPIGSRMSVSERYYINTPNGVAYGKQCYIYANAVYQKLFGESVETATSLIHSSIILSGHQNISYEIFRSAGVRIGAYMRTTGNANGSFSSDEGHSFIVLGYNEQTITCLEGNADNRGLIRITIDDWASFNRRKLQGRGRRLCHIVQPSKERFDQLYRETSIPCSKGHNASARRILRMPSLTSEGTGEIYCKKCNEVIRRITVAKWQDTTKVFSDVSPASWYTQNQAVNFAYNNELFLGVSYTEFAPDKPMTRAMFVTVLGRLRGVDETYSGDKPFRDVKLGKYYTAYVAWAAKKGIVEGYEDKTFRPNAYVTREQICKIMAMFCQREKIELKTAQDPIAFKDDQSISSWAKEHVDFCQKAGLVGGIKKKGGFVFKPSDCATRAQVATILMNLYQKNDSVL